MRKLLVFVLLALPALAQSSPQLPSEELCRAERAALAKLHGDYRPIPADDLMREWGLITMCTRFDETRKPCTSDEAHESTTEEYLPRYGVLMIEMRIDWESRLLEFMDSNNLMDQFHAWDKNHRQEKSDKGIN
jgi:hypothetical protein